MINSQNKLNQFIKKGAKAVASGAKKTGKYIKEIVSDPIGRQEEFNRQMRAKSPVYKRKMTNDYLKNNPYMKK